VREARVVVRGKKRKNNDWLGMGWTNRLNKLYNLYKLNLNNIEL